MWSIEEQIKEFYPGQNYHDLLEQKKIGINFDIMDKVAHIKTIEDVFL
jgi:hypothetical protein